MTITQTPSKTAYADAILAREDLTPEARVLVARTREDWEADPRDVLNRPQRDRLLGVGPTRGRELEKQGLPAYLDNGRRLTPASVVYIHKLNRILDSFPSDGPPLKAPGAPHMRPRPPRHGSYAAIHGKTPAQPSPNPRARTRRRRQHPSGIARP